MYNLSPVGLVMLMHAISPAADNAFPQLLTSLSMAKEKYHQHPRALVYRCNVRNKPLGQMMFSRRVWQACLSKGKILSAPSAPQHNDVISR